MWRTAGDKEVNFQQIRQGNDLAAAPKRSTRESATTGCDNDFRRRNGGIGVQKRGFHVAGHRSGDKDAVGMARGGDKIDSEAGKVEEGRGQNVGVGLATVAAGGGYLPKLEGPAEKLFEMLFAVCSKVGEVAVKKQMVSIGYPQLKIGREFDKIPFRKAFAEAAEDTASQVDQPFFRIDGILRAGACAAFGQFGVTVAVDFWTATVAVMKQDILFRVRGSPVSLVDSGTDKLQHILGLSSS